MWIPPKSPYNLIQEHFYDDPWKIFAVCLFCNLTRRVDAEPYIWKFFERYPTPEAASTANIDDLIEMIGPLGLSKRRSKTLIKMSDGYLRQDWRDRPG